MLLTRFKQHSASVDDSVAMGQKKGVIDRLKQQRQLLFPSHNHCPHSHTPHWHDVCTPGTYVYTWHYHNTNICEDHMNGKCKDCPTGYYQPNIGSDVTCKECPTGFFAIVAASPECLNCAPGKYHLERSCEVCPAGLTQPLSGKTSCLACNVGEVYMGNSTACMDVETCNSGHLWNGTTCVSLAEETTCTTPEDLWNGTACVDVKQWYNDNHCNS